MIVLWTGNLSVGIERFDDDHKRLIRLLNELHSATRYLDVNGDMESDEIEIALHRLDNYTRYHCSQEETAMAQTGFPGIEAHKREHEKLIQAIADMMLRFHGSTSPLHAEEMMRAIYDWIVDHINVVDKEYSEHLIAKGIH
jgi:hemerythrin